MPRERLVELYLSETAGYDYRAAQSALTNLQKVKPNAGDAYGGQFRKAVSYHLRQGQSSALSFALSRPDKAYVAPLRNYATLRFSSPRSIQSDFGKWYTALESADGEARALKVALEAVPSDGPAKLQYSYSLQKRVPVAETNTLYIEAVQNGFERKYSNFNPANAIPALLDIDMNEAGALAADITLTGVDKKSDLYVELVMAQRGNPEIKTAISDDFKRVLGAAESVIDQAAYLVRNNSAFDQNALNTKIKADLCSSSAAQTLSLAPPLGVITLDEAKTVTEAILVYNKGGYNDKCNMRRSFQVLDSLASEKGWSRMNTHSPSGHSAIASASERILYEMARANRISAKERHLVGITPQEFFDHAMTIRTQILELGVKPRYSRWDNAFFLSSIELISPQELVTEVTSFQADNRHRIKSRIVYDPDAKVWKVKGQPTYAYSSP